MQWPWRKPQNPWPRAISTVRLVRSILRRTHQLLCLQGLGGRGAEHHLSSLGAAALRTSFKPELLPTSTGRGGARERGSTAFLSHQAQQLGGRGSEGRGGWRCMRVYVSRMGVGRRNREVLMKRWRGERKRGWEKKGSTTFLFFALPGDLKTPPNGSFGLFGAFEESGRARLRRVLRLLVADARGGRGRSGLLRPGAAAGLRDAEAAAAAAILWGGLKLRKRLLHLVVSAAATFPARVRRRRGLRLPSSRHRAGVRSSGKLLPARSAGVGGRGDGPASPPSCSQPTHPLPPVAAGPGPDPAASRGPQSWRPNRAARAQEPLLARAVLLPAPATQRARVGAGRGRARRGPLRQWSRDARLRGCG